MNRYFWRWDPRNCSAVIRLNYSKFCAKLMWYFTNCLWLLFNPSDSPLPSQRLPLQWSSVFKVFQTDRPSLFLCLNIVWVSLLLWSSTFQWTLVNQDGWNELSDYEIKSWTRLGGFLCITWRCVVLYMKLQERIQYKWYAFKHRASDLILSKLLLANRLFYSSLLHKYKYIFSYDWVRYKQYT